jgi:hypothetical protein
MAELKNNFIKAKMNKDLDDRLVPTGEYRNAQNVAISRSEGSDVGALENILGNSILESTVLSIPNLDVIGFLADNTNNTIYLFLTDYTDTSVSGISNFAPLNANCIIAKYNTLTDVYIKLVEGRFLNFSKNNPIIGVNIIEELLFFTDNRNQPRKINVVQANASGSTSPSYYLTEDTISVAKPSPVEAIRLIDIAQGLPLVSTMTNPSQEFLPDGTTSNPDYNVSWAGDPNYLQDKFVRFSYRYKFDDGEYSLMAPFTQACFIPKQQGYFLEGDQEETYRSTVAQFVENNVTQIGLNISFDTIDPKTNLHITNLEILYKESDALAIKVVESVPISEVLSRMATNVDKKVYDFTYVSTKPYKTLPADQTTRVYDQVPVRALAQEVSGNRVMYGNFYDKMTPPPSLDYGVGFSTKVTNSQIEYPNHTAKQNRNYQIGIILADKFGRQSSVILSSKDTQSNNEEGVQYGGSTIYLPYYNGPAADILSWPGYALRVLFNQAIPATSEEQGYPGLYSETNPLGWYSYKIVVRQQEQDYYNVYLPGILNGYPKTAHGAIRNTEVDETANVILINDNINKIPRDLSEVGPDQKQYRSSVEIFGRVTPTTTLNQQYFPGTLSDTVVSISTIADTNYNETGGSSLNYEEFYQHETNPLVGRISTQEGIGIIEQTNNYNITLGVYETAPVVSLLDIFWETSSTGLISELNTAINTGFVGPYFINLNGGYIQNEGMSAGTKVVSGAFSEDSSGAAITTAVNFSFSSVIDGNGANRTSEFTISQTVSTVNKFDISTNALFYYGTNSNFDIANRSFTFTINCEDIIGGTTEQLQFTGSVNNVAPSVSNCPTSGINRNPTFDPWIIYTLQGVNGAASGINQTQGLTWGITSVALNGTIVENQDIFQISSTGVITNPNGTVVEGSNYQIITSLEDAGGLTAPPCNINVSIGVAQVTNRVFALTTVYSDNWNIAWSDGLQQSLDGTNCDSGCEDNISAGVPASNQATVTASNLLGTLQASTTYRFFLNNTQIHSVTQSDTNPYADISYTFANVQALDTLKVSIEYGSAVVDEYYTLSKCENNGTLSPGFISLQTVADFNDSLQIPGSRVENTGGNGYTFVVTNKTTTPGNQGIVDTGGFNCPPVYYYYILKPACASSSQELNVYSLNVLNPGDKVSVFSNCFEYYDTDPTESGTIDISSSSTCTCP